MSTKEKLPGNKAAATLFVGMGGIGSKIIRRVCDLAKNDDLSKAQFVILDTDVNDLNRSEDGIRITGIQTSSPRTIRDYLLEDDDAREEWFPNNMIINGKTVSEGAGQVRAISRLALNATIKTGRINALYSAIDNLYNKDGSDKKQTIKVVVASTVAGGTGSGIAMIVAMLIRNYIAENYPDSSAIIRGFLLLPSVMDSINPATSEKLSLRRNGYATLKEINAFMMRPFFQAVPELNRYLDLGVDVPNASGGVDTLQCSPFDFCFLFDRTDDNVSNMVSLPQYLSYAAHSIYEQCIGPMSSKASSKEDNIHREFLDEKKLSRNRFGAAGASVVRYPYETIRDYIAYEWIEKQIIGHSSEEVDDKLREDLMKESWLVYDKRYEAKKKAYEKNPYAGEEPDRAQMYIFGVETGTERFSRMLREKHIEPLNALYAEAASKKGARGNKAGEEDAAGTPNRKNKVEAIPCVEYYIRKLMEQVYDLCEVSKKEKHERDMFKKTGGEPAPKGQLKGRFDTIHKMEKHVDSKKILKITRAFIESVFGNNEPITAQAEPYMFESFVSLGGKAVHPNAVRYLLYKLADQLAAETAENQPEQAVFDDEMSAHRSGDVQEGGGRNTEKFQVLGGGKENTLGEMAEHANSAPGDGAREACNNLLNAYADDIVKWYDRFVRFYVCSEALPYVQELIKQYESFYDQFESKVVGLEKRKKSLLGDIAFENGDCELHLFRDPADLKLLVSVQSLPSGSTDQDRELSAQMYDVLKRKMQKAMHKDRFAMDNEGDVFETVIVAQYKDLVAEWCGGMIDVDIIRACALEHKIKCMRKAEQDPHKKEELLAQANDQEAKMAYMRRIIKTGQSLASPCVVSKGFTEPRAVEAMTYNCYMEEGDGMTMPGDLFVADNAAPSVSKYEFRFFRSFYNMTPMQLQKLCPPQTDPGALMECVDRAAPGMVGAYFTAYQEYMAKIGPDNRLNPVITPHIDKRWNSITVLPELDPQGYQRILMKRIHKALIYGFVLQLIEKRQASAYDPEKLVYEYTDGRNGMKKFTVSNHTKCDRLFEVLDSLYFDRYAVHSIHDTMDGKRKREYECSTAYEETTFARYLRRMDRQVLIDVPARRELAEKKLKNTADRWVSLFEIPLLYWNSLPKKDSSELEIMIDATFEILEKEIGTFADSDDAVPLIAGSIRDHYDMMLKNYETCPEVYAGSNALAPKNNPALKVIRKKVLEKISDLDVSQSGAFALCDQTDKDMLFV